MDALNSFAFHTISLLGGVTVKANLSNTISMAISDV